MGQGHKRTAKDKEQQGRKAAETKAADERAAGAAAKGVASDGATSDGAAAKGADEDGAHDGGVRDGVRDTVREYSVDELAALLPQPAADANKYSRGKAVLVAGCAKYPGAACLAARASQRVGAGYTEVLCAPESVPAVRAASPSLVVSPWDDLLELADWTAAAEVTPDEGESAAQGQDSALLCSLFPADRPGHPRAFLVGSGFDGGDPESAALVRTVLERAQAPVVVDGGGLAALALPGCREAAQRRFVDGLVTVVTPHAGEAARLAAPLGIATDDPAEAARRLSLAYGVVAVVKGPTTYISDGEQVVRMAEGSAALAKAGTGDVLAGMLTGLLAQGMRTVDACALAATLHAWAGRAAAARLTDICVAAEDVVEALSQVVKSLMGRAESSATE